MCMQKALRSAFACAFISLFLISCVTQKDLSVPGYRTYDGCDGFIGNICVVNRSNEKLWKELPYYIHDIGDMLKDQCGRISTSNDEKTLTYTTEWTPDITLIILPEWSYMPYTSIQSNGLFTTNDMIVGVRYNTDINKTSIVHELVEHVMPFVCKDDLTANVNHDSSIRNLSNRIQKTLNKRYEYVGEK